MMRLLLQRSSRSSRAKSRDSAGGRVSTALDTNGWFRRPRARNWSALIAVALLAGCGHSPPATFLAIDPVPAAVSPAVRPYSGPSVRVPFVHVPIVLDRTEFAAESDGHVTVADFSRWAAPLPLLARDAFVRDLQARLSPGSVLPADAAPAPSELRVEVTVTAFHADAGGSVMQATYRVVPPTRPRSPSPVVYPDDVTLTAPTPAGPAPAAAAQAWGALLGQLADRIAIQVAAVGAHY